MASNWKKIEGYEKLEISTCGRYYPILSFFELPEKFQKIAKKEFDYLSEDIEETDGYFIYKNHLYNLSNFMQGDNTYRYGKGKKFRVDGVMGDSYFSATIVEIDKYNENLKVGAIIC